MKKKYLEHFLQVSGAGVSGVLLSFLVELPVFWLAWQFKLWPMNISFKTAFLLSSLFLILFLALTWWALKSLPVGKRGKVLVREGPYHYIRHPSYAAKIFLLLPGLAILFRTWLPFLTMPLLFLIWQAAVDKEEKELKKNFGKSYDEYCLLTGRYLPFLKG